MAEQDDTSPAARLRLLETYHLTPRRGTQHHRRPTGGPPGLPIRVNVYDHLQKTLEEATDFTRDANPSARPRPAQLHQVYRWLVEETPDLDAARQRARDALIYRQGMEHAILMGDHKVVRPHPCPSCGTWGLHWNKTLETVVCVHRRCTDDNGVSSKWTLAEIADAHVERRETSRRRAT